MRAIDANQEELSKASSLATIALVKLTTYQDRDALTEGDVFYFSDRSLWYKYGGGSAIRFTPWLLQLNDLSTEMTHMPSAAAGDLISKTFSLTLANSLWPEDASGDRVSELLKANYPLEMATVEIAQLLVPRYFGYYPQDLSSFAGTEHTVFYRGKVSRVGPITGDSIQIQCTTDSPEIAWNRPNDPALASPRDLGARYPRPYGAFKKLRLVAHTTGWATTLAQSITDTQTGVVSITDGTGLSSGSVSVEGEEITYSSATDTSMTISARGENAAAHNAGTAVIELIAEMILVAADEGFAPINGITALYVRNPFNGQLVRVTTAYEFDASDTVDGLTVSTVKMSQAQLRSMYAELYLSARITVQPSFDLGAAPSLSTVEPSVNGSEELDVAGERGFWADAPPIWFDQDDDTAHTRWDEDMAASGFDGAKDVLRWRLTLEVKNIANNTGQSLVVMTSNDAISGISPGTTLQVWCPNVLNESADAQSAWFQPAAGTKQSALHSKSFSIVVDRYVSGFDSVEITEWGIECELEEGTTQEMDIETESVGLGLGYDHEFYADGEGPFAAASYGFDDDANWNEGAGITRSTDTDIKYRGTGSQKLVLATTSRIQCESADSSEAAQWNAGADADVDDEGSITTEGAGSIKGTSTSAVASADIDFTLASPVDLEAGFDLLVLADVRIDKQGASGGEVQLILGSDSSNYKRWDYADTQFNDDQWHTVVLKITASADDTQGSPDLSAWDFFRVIWNTGSTQVVGMLCYVDNVRTVPRLSDAQKNDVASIDLSSTDDEYQYALRLGADAREILEQVEVYFDNTAGTGATPPFPRRIVIIEDGDFAAADTWVSTSSEVIPTGDVDAVQTIGIRLEIEGDNVFDLVGDSFTVYVDALQTPGFISDNYDASAGDLLEQPTDIFVHWCEVIGGVFIDTTSLAASLTNLGSNILAVDMRTLTPGDWKPGLAGLGYLSRANMIPEETAAGTVYKMLTAQSGYDFPAADESLTVFNVFSEAGILERELWTRFTCFYAFNAATQIGNEESYEGHLRADEDSNDLTVPSTADFEAAVDKYGNMEAAPIFLGGINDEATAKDVFGYIAHESIRAPRIFLFEGCAWWEVYRWEVGDVKQFIHPFSGLTVKFRILGYDKVFRSEANTLRCIEVE